jgi:Fe-S-cluster-containing dehydrogenase component/CRP-like cAMP-binding protein
MPPRATNLERPQRWDAAFDPEMSDAIVDRLLTVPPFSNMKPENFPARLPLHGILKNDTRLHTCKSGEIILRQGDYGTSAFMVLSGEARVVLRPGLPASMLGRRVPSRKGFLSAIAHLWSNAREPERMRQEQAHSSLRIHNDERRVFLQDVPRLLDKFQTAIIEHGEFFGEIAALSRMPRSASVFANNDCEVLEIRWQGLRDLMKNDPALRAHIDKIYRERALVSALRQIPIFRGLSDKTLEAVKAVAQFDVYGDYDWSGDYKRLVQSEEKRKQEPAVALEGDYPNGVVFIKAGFGRVSQKYGNGERTLNYIGAGQVYGLQEIAHNWRKPNDRVSLQYTLRVMGYTHVIVIPTDAMEKLVLPEAAPGSLPPLVTPVEEVEPMAAPPVNAAQKIGDEMLEFLTENRFLNGTATMMINLDRCTRCDDCVRACAAAHDNNPRFLRHGPSRGKIMVANACMHCADPVCMIGCPTGAIHRYELGGQVVINPATCVGCKACFNHCPYDAIRMVESRDENGDLLLDKESKPIPRATKCDLCVEQMTGPACQAACPHGALARINLNDIDAFARWLKR